MGGTMVLVQLVFLVFTATIQTSWGAVIKSGNLGIVGGYEVTIEEAPYMVSLFASGRFSCGGTIVHEMFILTAAHCILKIYTNRALKHNEIKVLIGSNRLNYGGIFIDVDRILVHPEYNNVTDHNDIALLKVRQPLINSYLRTAEVRLPADSRMILEGTMVNISGWGWTKNNGHILSNELRQITTKVVSNEYCILIYGNLSDGEICAGSRGIDSCQGDSGGPMTYEGMQIGIVSTGRDCGEYPGIYTRVASYLDWIKYNIEDNL